MEHKRLSMRALLSFIAAANFAVTIWHLHVVAGLDPGAPIAVSLRIATYAGVLTLAGIALAWTGWPKIGSLVLIVVFALGFVIGGSEHFLAAGPTNVFDVGGAWALPFKITVAILVLFQVAGLAAAGRLLAAR